MERQAFIYKITSPSGRIYIGQTLYLKSRLTMHKSLAKRSKCKLHASIKKYGWNNHVVEILEDGLFTKERLDELEIRYIAQFDCFKKGLNMTLGGDGVWGYIKSDEVLERQSQKMTGEKNPFYNKKHSPEVIEFLRQRSTGKTLSAESRKKVGDASRGNSHAIGFSHTDEAKKRMSIASKGNQHNLGNKVSQDVKDRRAKKQRQKVYSSVADKTFNSIQECSDHFGLHNSTIASMFAGKIINRFGLVKIYEPKIECTATGRVYFTAREAARIIGIREGLLCAYLEGKRNNRTSMRYIDKAA